MRATEEVSGISMRWCSRSVVQVKDEIMGGNEKGKVLTFSVLWWNEVFFSFMKEIRLSKTLRKPLEMVRFLFGAAVVSSSPVNVEISGYAGYHFTFIDSEHATAGPYGSHMEHLIGVSHAADIFSIVRAVENDRAQTKKVLDFGAKGILVLFINNKDDAQKVFQACCFPPKRKSGGFPVVRASRYGTRGLVWFHGENK